MSCCSSFIDMPLVLPRSAGAAILKKNSIDEGWQFFPEVKQHGMGSYASARKFDFTMTAERPRGWTNVAE